MIERNTFKLKIERPLSQPYGCQLFLRKQEPSCHIRDILPYREISFQGEPLENGKLWDLRSAILSVSVQLCIKVLSRQLAKDWWDIFCPDLFSFPVYPCGFAAPRPRLRAGLLLPPQSAPFRGGISF